MYIYKKYIILTTLCRDQKSFLHPIRVYALVEYGGSETSYLESIGMDKKEAITINFHKRRLTDDQNLFVREGDFVRYGTNFYEIVKLVEPKQLFGQIDHRFEITAMCIDAREGLFDGS